MVTKVKFKDKKRDGTTWVNGKPVRFKNGVAVVEDDKIAKELAKKEDYNIIKEDSEEDNKPNEKGSNNSKDNKPNKKGANGKK